MSITLNDNLKIKSPKPTRDTDRVGTGHAYATKEDIPVTMLWDGMQTFDGTTNWQWTGGAWVNIDDIIPDNVLLSDGSVPMFEGDAITQGSNYNATTATQGAGYTIIYGDQTAIFTSGSFIQLRGSGGSTLLGYATVTSSSVSGNTTVNFTPSNSAYVDVYDIAIVDHLPNPYTPMENQDIATKIYVDEADALRVPYTGATGDVDLGENNLISAGSIGAKNSEGSGLLGTNILSFSQDGNPSGYGGFLRGSTFANGNTSNLPLAGGTLATEEYIATNSVPYTGATSDVNIGTNQIIAKNGIFYGDSTTDYNARIILSQFESGGTGNKLIVLRPNDTYVVDGSYDIELPNGSGTLATQEWVNKAPTIINAATYTVLTIDNILHVTYTATGACTITIPSALITTSFRLTIKDGGNNASVNNITIATEGSETIDWDATYVINGDKNAINLYSDGTNIYIY